MENKAVAFQVADAISIRKSEDSFKGKLLFSESDELFYERFPNQYVYIFKYGVICFYGITDAAIESVLNELKAAFIKPQEETYSKQIDISIEGGSNKVTFGMVKLSVASVESLRLIMLNVSQAVALAKYGRISEEVLEETKLHTTYLEEQGKLDIGGKELKKYIGKVLNIKNKISENLYIFESHQVTWEDESLEKLDRDLKKLFDLRDRYRSLSERLQIIKDNLDLFKDIMFHRESSKLEWIIIILILVEVIDLFILKIK